MRWAILALMGWMLLRPGVAMPAASGACRLFVHSVLPGLFPYMVLTRMFISRAAGKLRPGVLMLLGWCGGSPCGAQLMHQAEVRDLRLAVRCATMSPIFLAGTCGVWLGSAAAGWIVLIAVLAGGYVAGWLVPGSGGDAEKADEPVALGQAVESAARTMLMVCGTMVMLRVAAALAAEALPLEAELPVVTLLEVTSGVQRLAELPLPLAWRTALTAGVTGFGGAAVMMQNRAVYPPGMVSLPKQAALQAAHGGSSFLIALGSMMICGI